MKERTKEIIKDGFGSLVSNASAMRGAKAGPLWLTIVMFFLAIILPIVPLFVQQATTNGSTFLNTYSFGLEKYVTALAIDLKQTRSAEFIIGEDHLLTIKEAGTEVNFSNYDQSTPYAAYKNEATGQYDFIVYLSDAIEDKDKTDFVSQKVAKTNYVMETTNIADMTTTENVYRPSFMVLFKNGCFVAVYASHSTKGLASSYYGDYKTIAANNNCLQSLLTVENYAPDLTKTQALADEDYTKGVYTNFKKFLDKSYETLKIKNTWLTSLIYFGIYFGLSFLMGLLMFLLTRGKNNPNNYFSLWLCLKIQGRLSFCPGLLTLIIGFFLTNYAPMIFIMMIGLRVMWISMKELRPIQR